MRFDTFNCAPIWLPRVLGFVVGFVLTSVIARSLVQGVL